MAIPKFTKDVEVIQKLSDLPNATDGLTANELKAKFDEAAKLEKAFLNDELIPAIQAKNIPFDKTEAIDAEDIQNAIIEVQKQVRDAASGTIVNGSVTKEKLAAELLARVYGGRPWVSMKTPDSGDNVAADFPIGQVWFRPAFDVVNARTTNWTGNGCTVAAEEQKVTLTGNKTVATASMTQSLTGIGQEGDMVHVLFDLTERDSEINGVTVTVNGGAAQAISGSVEMEAELMVNGSLALEIGATWPSTSLAGGNLVIENLAIVNVSQIMRQLSDAKGISDWEAYLRNLLPLESHHSPTETYIQMTDGNWWPISFEILPVSRGGTGMNGLDKDHFLVGGENRELRQAGVEDVVSLLGALRIKTGTYTGNDAVRAIELPVAPKVLFITTEKTPTVETVSGSYDRQVVNTPKTLVNGSKDAERWKYMFGTDGDGVPNYTLGLSYVQLEGDTLTFDGVNPVDYYPKPPAKCANESGTVYTWTAIY